MLGSGGLVEVCLAWDERDRRPVAIKVLKTDDLDQQPINRFVKEAGQVVGWQHPHILRVYDHTQTEVIVDGEKKLFIFYIVMEYASGGDLYKRMRADEPYFLSRQPSPFFAKSVALCNTPTSIVSFTAISSPSTLAGRYFARPLFRA